MASGQMNEKTSEQVYVCASISLDFSNARLQHSIQLFGYIFRERKHTLEHIAISNHIHDKSDLGLIEKTILVVGNIERAIEFALTEMITMAAKKLHYSHVISICLLFHSDLVIFLLLLLLPNE